MAGNNEIKPSPEVWKEIIIPQESISPTRKRVLAGSSTNLSENLKPKYPEISLSKPGKNSPQIRTYHENKSSFVNEGNINISGSFSVQDLVIIIIKYFYSPDIHENEISDIILFPTEKNLPSEQYNKNKNGTYDYLEHDEENKQEFEFKERTQQYSKTHYFRVSPDDKVLLPDIEKVEPCNGWYFHHIVIDNKCWYKTVNGQTIQEVIYGLIDQQKRKEQPKKEQEKEEEQIEKRNNEFAKRKEYFIKELKFSEKEFWILSKFPWKWKMLWFFTTVKKMLTINSSKITKKELLDWIKEMRKLDKTYFRTITKEITGSEVYGMNSWILRNYILLKRNKDEIQYSKAEKVVNKANAWKYLRDYIPWISFEWNFKDAVVALKIALDSWLFGKKEMLSWNQDFWIKLANALDEKNKNKRRKK